MQSSNNVQMLNDTTTLSEGSTTDLPQSGNVGTTQKRNTVSTQKGSTGKTHKITFYPGPGQEHKLNELIFQYWQRHDRMLNQNDILRYMVEQYTIDDLEEALRLEEE